MTFCIQILNLISRGVLRATLITLCPYVLSYTVGQFVLSLQMIYMLIYLNLFLHTVL